MSSAKKIRGIYLRGNIFWFRHGTGKKRKQFSLETRDEAAAVQKAKEFLENPELNPCNGFIVAMDRYAREKVAEGTWTCNSEESKTSVLKMFAEDLSFKDLPKITTLDVQKWYNDQKKRVPSSAPSYMIIVQAFLNWAVKQNLIRRNPMDGVKLGKITQTARIRFCSFEQRDKIMAAADGKDDLLFILYCGFYAGMRKDEIIEARPDWFDLENNVIHVENTATFSIKNKKYRTVPLHPDFRRFLERYGKPSPFMLQPDVQKGEARYRYDFRRPFENHMVALEFDWVTPHVMRHSFASLLAINGVSLFKIAKWLGDTLRTTEKHYAHLAPEDNEIEKLSAEAKANGKTPAADEIFKLQEILMRYEDAIKALVPAGQLAAYWARMKTQEPKMPAAAN